MDDPLVVRGGEAGERPAAASAQRFAGGQRPAAQPLAQRLALEQLGDHVRHAVLHADVVDDEQVGVVEGAGGARLLVEAPQRLGVAGLARRGITLIATSRPSRGSRAR